MTKPNLKDTLRGGLGAAGLKATPPIRRDSPLDPTRAVVEAAKPMREIPAPAPSPDAALTKQNMTITVEQYRLLRDAAQDLQHNGMRHPERITLNTVIRCFLPLIEPFMAATDTSKVATEEDLRRLVQEWAAEKPSNLRE